jgi:acyl carrier protein
MGARLYMECRQPASTGAATADADPKIPHCLPWRSRYPAAPRCAASGARGRRPAMAEPVTIDDVKNVILDALNLREDMGPDDMDAEKPLFGPTGLGLDSLDALQLAVALEERWGVTVDEQSGSSVFRSIRTVTDHVNATRAS